MMNYERLVVGIQAIAAAEWSYQNAAAYARDRLQGRSPAGPQAPGQKADAIIVHPDIRRMLMTAKAMNEGARAFYVYVAKWLDKSKFGQEEHSKKLAEERVALLTPVAKAFISDMAFVSAVDCQQVFGGHGYVREWGQEQFVRDIRITQIYEGTNGVQAMDLLGRKIVATGGSLLVAQTKEINDFIDLHLGVLRGLTLLDGLRGAVHDLNEVTDHVISVAANNPEEIGAAAVEYLHLFGYVMYAYMWAKMAVAASEAAPTEPMEVKLKTAGYYFQRVLPRIESLKRVILHGSDSVMALSAEQF
jgi:Acetyl-CoA dehydrogenase C-terminal like/Acyl-CoA dehydrogenase, C-terminal domain